MELDLSDVYAQLVATLRELLNCNGVAVLMRGDAALTVPTQFGSPPLSSSFRLDPGAHDALQLLARTRRPLAQRGLAPFTPPLPTPGSGPDWIALPLTSGMVVYGYVCLAGSFAPDDEQRALAIVRLAAQALRLAARIDQEHDKDQQLRDLEQRIRQQHDQAAALALVVDASIALTQATHSCVFGSKHGRAAMLARRGYSAEEAALVQQIPPSLDQGLTGRAFRSGAIVRSHDIEQDPGALPALASTRAQLVIPIRAEGQCLGVIDLQSPRPYAFRQANLGALERLGELAGLALAQPITRSLGGPAHETEVLAEHDLLLSSRLAVVTDLAAGVAHEINNPLTTILGYTHLMLRDQSLPPAMRGDIGQIMVEGQRIAALVERFLRFAQPASTGKGPLLIDEPLREALALLRSRMQEGGVQLELSMPPTVPMVIGQSGQLEQAFLELLQNALEAMSTSDTRQLSVQVAEQAGWVRVAIGDSGRGIRPDLLARVFEPGFTTKVDQGVSRGLGLGLYAVHTIAQDHWGRVEVQSQVRQGSTFTVCLPAI